MSRTGRHGEWKFGELCQAPDVNADVVVNRVVDDQNGWDYVIDIVPPRRKNLSEDLQTHLIQCFTQIKTTNGPVARAKLKLSNALKAAKSPCPCFVFLLKYEDLAASPIVFGRHVWKEEILHWLKRAREGELLGRNDLHNLSVIMSFRDGDRIDGHPINWMLSVLDSCGSGAYAKNKLALVESLGYEESFLEGSLTFSADTAIEDIVDHELGLVDTLPIADFIAFDKRFGLKSKLPVVRLESGSASFIPEGRALILQIQSQDGEIFDVPASGWMPTLVASDHPAFRLRVEAGHIELIANGVGSGGRFNLIRRPDDSHSLLQHLGFLRLVKWSQIGPVKFRVLADVGQLFSGEIDVRLSQDPWVLQCESTLSHVVELLTRERCREIKASLSDLSKVNRDLSFVAAIAQSRHFRVRLEESCVPAPVEKLIGYSYSEVDSWSLGAIYELECEGQDFTAGWLEFRFGNPKIIRTFAFKRPLSEIREHILLEFNKYRGAADANVVTFQEGDFVDWARVFREQGALTMTVSD